MEELKKLEGTQKLYERWFVVAVMANPEIAFKEYAWLSPKRFLDKESSAFWAEFLKNGGDPDKAALASNTLQQINEVINEMHEYQRIDVYVEGIINTSKCLRMAKRANDLQKASMCENVQIAEKVLTALYEEIIASSWTTSGFSSCLEVSSNFEKLVDIGFDGISSGIESLDNAIGRLQRKQVSVMASRTSVGKTALAWQIARDVASQGLKVLYISTEMSKESLWARAVAGAAGIDWRRITSGVATDEEKSLLKEKSIELANNYPENLFVDDNAYTLDAIHRAVAKISPDLIIVDHLDELTRPMEYRNLVEWLAAIMSSLRRLAVNYNAHVMAVHQVNRAPEERADKLPTLADLRNSGDIEQKADCVFILHRPDMNTIAENKDVVSADLWIRKNRMGVLDARVSLDFHLKEQRFTPKPKEISHGLSN